MTSLSRPFAFHREQISAVIAPETNQWGLITDAEKTGQHQLQTFSETKNEAGLMLSEATATHNATNPEEQGLHRRCSVTADATKCVFPKKLFA